MPSPREQCRYLWPRRLSGSTSTFTPPLAGFASSRANTQVWITVGDIILLSLREFQDDKADVIHRYTPDEARNLKTYGELKSDFQITEGAEGESSWQGVLTGRGRRVGRRGWHRVRGGRDRRPLDCRGVCIGPPRRAYSDGSDSDQAALDGGTRNVCTGSRRIGSSGPRSRVHQLTLH